MTGNGPEAVEINTTICKAANHLRLTHGGQSDRAADLEDNQEEETDSKIWTHGESDVRLMQ